MGSEFGATLRQLRISAGLSLAELARRVNYSKAYMSRLENAQRAPNIAVARLCDSVLDAGGYLVAMVEKEESGKLVSAELDNEMWKLDLSDGGDVWFRTEPNGSFDKATLMGFTHSRVTRAPVDSRAIDALRGVFDHCVVLGRLGSPVDALGLVIAQVNTLRSIAGASPEPHRDTLMRLASRGAGFAAWMTQETGDERAATWWARVSAEFAEVCGDTHLAIRAVLRRVDIALGRHDPVAALKLIGQVWTSQRVDARAAAWIALREAGAYALVGDTRGHADAMDRAAGWLHGREDDRSDDQGFGYFPEGLQLARGWCLFDMGRPREAAELLAQGVAEIASDDLRSRVRFTVRLALAHVFEGEVDQACREAGSVLADIVQVDSATAREDVRQLLRALTRWRTSPAAQELSGELLHVLRA